VDITLPLIHVHVRVLSVYQYSDSTILKSTNIQHSTPLTVVHYVPNSHAALNTPSPAQQKLSPIDNTDISLDQSSTHPTTISKDSSGKKRSQQRHQQSEQRTSQPRTCSQHTPTTIHYLNHMFSMSSQAVPELYLHFISPTDQSINQSTLLKPPGPSRPVQPLHLHPHRHRNIVESESNHHHQDSSIEPPKEEE
jgi:hypothetical protein